MNELQIFNNKEFGEIRTLEMNGEPWLLGKDVAEILKYTNTPKALRDHVDDEDKLTERIVLSGQNRLAVFINESGLYSLIMSSKLPTAKQFKRWVTSEVLPTIRKHGAYMTDQKAYDITHNPNSLADLLLQAGEQLKQKDLIIQEMKPKAVFADAVATSKNSILIGELAKILKQNGYNTGQNREMYIINESGLYSLIMSSKLPTAKQFKRWVTSDIEKEE